jgi:hypothetical protein
MRYLLALPLVALLALSGCTVGPDEPIDQSGSADAAPADAGLLPFMSECTEDEQCDTGLCYPFNQGPALCSHSCTLDTDCEAPSTGCNNNGVCKRPNGDNDNGADAGVDGDGGL